MPGKCEAKIMRIAKLCRLANAVSFFSKSKLAPYSSTSLACKSLTQKMFQAHCSTGRLCKACQYAIQTVTECMNLGLLESEGEAAASLSYTNTI